jgi:hypothetical protein
MLTSSSISVCTLVGMSISRSSRRPVTLRRLAVFAVVAATGALSACGAESASGDEPNVATVAGASAGASVPVVSASATAEERPLIRTDTSAEEEDRFYEVWIACLEANGLPRKETGLQASVSAEVEAKAQTACSSKHPESVWERAKRLDPQYADKLHVWVACLRSHGIKANEDNGFVSFEDGLPSGSKEQWIDKCQDEAFGKG